MIPPNLTAGTKLAVYRASGLVRRPDPALGAEGTNGRNAAIAVMLARLVNYGSRPQPVSGDISPKQTVAICIRRVSIQSDLSATRIVAAT